MSKAWRQSVKYVSRGTTPGWSWRCTEMFNGPADSALQPCTSTGFSRTHGYGFSSASEALKAALVHRYQCHFRGEGKWSRVHYYGHYYWKRDD